MPDAKKEYNKALDYIFDRFKDGSLSIGDKIPSERQISAQLGISRNSTREALRCLENMGFVESRQGAGNFVHGDVTDSLSIMNEMMVFFKKYSFDDIYDFRRCMDKTICELLISRYNDLNGIADQAEKIITSPVYTLEEEVERDMLFHDFLLKAAGNSVLETFSKSLFVIYESVIETVLKNADEHKKELLMDAHLKLLEALRSRKMNYCIEAVENHYIIASGQLKDKVWAMKDFTLEQERYDILIKAQQMFNSLKIDALTGLYTKEYFFKKVKEHIEDHPEQNFILCTSDIIGLNIINEKYGFEVGDDFIKKLAKKGSEIPGYVFGGRVEGDKFCACIADDNNEWNYTDMFVKSVIDHGMPVQNVTIKNGIYRIKKNDSLSIQSMYLRTILAIQQIKDNYNKYINEYEESFRSSLLMNRQIVADSSGAIEHGDFKVYYQPKILTAGDQIGGAEALVRWVHPEFGFMNPGVFIPIFEKNGFITQLGFYIWEEVCKNIKEWKERNLPVVPVSVNVSRRDFETENLAEKIIDLVDSYGIEHSLLEIEITESSFIDSLEKVESVVKKLHDAGFSIALDDFGTGYSSMIALSRLELDVIKMDMSLIANDKPDVSRNALDFSFQLAKMVKLKTVAEGIETEEQVKRIKSLGGDYIQGYYYSSPLPKEEFEIFITKNM